MNDRQILQLVQQRLAVSFAETRKNCKAKACGATCIAMTDKCLIDTAPGISDALTRSSTFISSLGSGATKEELEESIVKAYASLDNTQQKAFDRFGQLVKEGKVTDEEMQQVANLIASVALNPKQENRGAARVMSYEEIKAIHDSGRLQKLESAYNASIKSGTFDPNAPGGMAEYVKKNIVKAKVSDEVAELAYSMLPAAARNSINNAGSVTGEGQVFNGYDSKGNVVFGSSGNKERGVMLVKRWMEQKGEDPFSGQYIDIRKGEPEHLFSWSQAKGSGGKGDQPGNLAIAAPQTNNSKAAKDVDDDFGKWAVQVKKWYDLGPERYNSEVVEPKMKKAAAAGNKKAEAGSEVEKAFAATTPKERVAMVVASAKAYGDRVRYLTIAAGLESGQWGQNIPGARAPRRQEMDARATLDIDGRKVKPSVGVLAAAATLDPAKRASFLREVDKLRIARSPSTQEIKSYEGSQDPRYIRKMAELDRQFEKQLSSLIQRSAPSLGSLL